MRIRLKIKRPELRTIVFAVISFYSVMSITYLSSILHISSMITFLMRILIIGGLNLLMIVHRRVFSTVYKLLWIWWGLIFASSIINKCDLFYMITLQSRVMAVCSVLEYYSKYKKQMRTLLYAWKNILLLLCVFDLITIVLFPNGLYTGDLYADVWLLGYKTARLVYNLPLAILSCYLSNLDRGKISFGALATVLCCALSSMMVEASGASISLIVYAFIIYYCAIGRRSKLLREFLNKILSFKSIVMIYSVAVALVVTGSNVVIRFAQDTLGKSETLSHRTIVWERCFQNFLQSPIIGKGYLTTTQYVEKITLLRLGTNPHNMVFSILLTAGLFGLALYIFIFYTAIKKCGKNYSICSLVLIAGTVTYMILGLTSSALVFSAFTFLPHLLMNYRLDEK